jgi:hypothetical protein
VKLESLHRGAFVCALVFAATIAVRVAVSGFEASALHLPDDAFYYLQVAHTYATTGVHSFDRGVSVNTGFHLLWFYWLAGIAALVPEKPLFLVLAVTSSIAASLGTVVLAASSLWKQRTAQLLALALASTSYAYVNGQYAALEWPLAVACSVLLYRFIGRPMGISAVAFFALGVAGSLARTDFGGVPACFLVGALWLNWRRQNRTFFRPAAALWMGALAGFVLVAVHNQNIAGDWVSSSARVKQMWAQHYPANPVPALYQFARALLYLPPLPYTGSPELRQKAITWGGTALVVVLLSGVALGWWLRRSIVRTWSKRGSIDDVSLFFFVSGASTVSAYLVLYSFGPTGMQSWYSAHVVVPLTLGVGALVDRSTTALCRLANPPSAMRAAAPSAVICCLVLINVALVCLSRPTYEHQAALVGVAKGLKEAVLEGRFEPPLAAPDVGIVGFYSDGLVVNTDGLVNADVARTPLKRLPCYLNSSGLRHVAGFGLAAESVAPIPWDQISTLRTVNTTQGAFSFHEVDLDAVERVYRCTGAN